MTTRITDVQFEMALPHSDLYLPYILCAYDDDDDTKPTTSTGTSNEYRYGIVWENR